MRVFTTSIGVFPKTEAAPATAPKSPEKNHEVEFVCMQRYLNRPIWIQFHLTLRLPFETSWLRLLQLHTNK